MWASEDWRLEGRGRCRSRCEWLRGDARRDGLRSRRRCGGVGGKVRCGVWRSGDWSWGGCLKQRGSGGFEVERGLDAGFGAAGDKNSFKPAMAELGSVGIECVVPCIERGEAEGPVFGGGGAGFSAGGLIAQNDGDASQRGRSQIGEAPGERARLRSLNLDELRRGGGWRAGLGIDCRCAQAQYRQRQTLNPVPP